MNAQNDTTVRISTTTILDSIRNVRSRIAVLALRRCNNGFLTAEQNAELTELHAKLDKLDREYYDAQQLAQQRTTS